MGVGLTTLKLVDDCEACLLFKDGQAMQLIVWWRLLCASDRCVSCVACVACVSCVWFGFVGGNTFCQTADWHASGGCQDAQGDVLAPTTR